MSSDWKVVGRVGVDSGTIGFIDPCNAKRLSAAYRRQVKAIEAGRPWRDENGAWHTKHGLGFILGVGGDGWYPVEARFTPDGLYVAEIRIRTRDYDEVTA